MNEGPTQQKRRRWRRAVLTGLAVAAAFVVATCTPYCVNMVTPGPPGVPAGSTDHGTFRRIKGVGVLTLRGSPRQRGRAHGYLMARAIVEMVDVVCGSNLLLGDTDDYEETILPIVKRFRFQPDDEAELAGIIDGVRDKLGDAAVLEKIGRPITLDDLKAYNTAGDWYRQACSSFAAWGSVARDGHVWVGRNFDFLPAKEFYSHQMILVHRPAAGKKAWATVTAPGMIGCITGINAEGVFTAVHDVFLDMQPLREGYTPRLMVLRRLMERCEPRDLAAQALPVLESRLQMFDNAILLAAPVTDGTPPALVFEYNGDRSGDRGVTVRRVEDNEKELSREMITCTNHFRKRKKPDFNLLGYRYPLMRRVLMTKTGRGEKVDFDIARKTMGAVRLPITVHTVIADLNTRDYWFASGDYLLPPGNRDFVKLPMKEWLTATEADSAPRAQ